MASTSNKIPTQFREGFTTILSIQSPNNSPSLPLILIPLPFQRTRGTGGEISVPILPSALVSVLSVLSVVQHLEEVKYFPKFPSQWAWECDTRLDTEGTEPDTWVLPLETLSRGCIHEWGVDIWGVF